MRAKEPTENGKPKYGPQPPKYGPLVPSGEDMVARRTPSEMEVGR